MDAYIDLEEGVQPAGKPDIKILRELAFPLNVVKRGITPSLQTLKASQVEDCRHILSKIAQSLWMNKWS